MKTPELFNELEWQVARARRQSNRFEAREEEDEGKGRAILESTLDKLDEAALAWVEGARHAGRLEG